MPLLSRRRSAFDLLLEDARKNTTNHIDGEDQTAERGRLSTSYAEDRLLPLPREKTRRPATQCGPPPRPEPSSPRQSDLDSPVDSTSASRMPNMLKWRTFSDTQLAATARRQAAQDEAPPVPSMPENVPVIPSPTAPAIIRTSPTMEMADNRPKSSPKKQKTPFMRQFSKLTSPSKLLLNPDAPAQKPETDQHIEGAANTGFPFFRKSFERRSFEQSRKHDTPNPSIGPKSRTSQQAPPAYGDESSSALALPVTRLSDSSGGDRSSGEHVTYAQTTTTTTHTVSTTTTLFKLPRRNRRKSLFPLPIKIEPPSQLPNSNATNASTSPSTPRASTSAISAKSELDSPSPKNYRISALQRRHTDVTRPRSLPSPTQSPTHEYPPIIAAHGGAPLLGNESDNSTQSGRSLAPPMRAGLRERSSTVNSFGRRSDDMNPPTPPTLHSGRNSTSTAGRTSLGGFLGFNRFRHGSESSFRNASPAGSHSKSSSFAMSREALVIPQREEGDTPGRYLERLQAAVSRSLIAGILSRSPDPFAQAVLRSYCRKFAFFGEPIDMSLRKFLLEAELPKETQQVDRVIQAFSDRYHECNPGIFISPDSAYIIAFSIMMLHTDAFNRNNKYKMQKQDYIKNTSGQNVCDDVLACFYDNICYTPFIHFDEEVDINGERLLAFKPKKSKLRGNMPEPGRKPSGPIDPYALICDGKLDTLRPTIRESITLEDPYSYLGTAPAFDIYSLHKSFVNTGVLQIISARSRPAAFESQATRDNPSEAAAGVVDLKITKIGILWRKSAKRKKARSPWQEWGAVLTGSQLYLFKNLHWVKGLMSQQQNHIKTGNTSSPIIFKPPIQEFKPDALIKTDDAVALLDKTYSRHKDAFTLVRHGGHEEVLIAENEGEMNEWIALINYAAAFRSAGVRIRGFIGGTENDVTARSRTRLDSSTSLHSIPSPPDTEISPQKRNMTPQLARQVLAARRQIMLQTIVESDREITDASRNLENMLRNARHLLVLAPIQPKTREAVILAAARMDAMLKWVRRDIWRTKCHRDILSLDLELDKDQSDKGAPLSPLSALPGGSARLASGLQSAGTANGTFLSPPQSPRFVDDQKRPETRSSSEGFFGNDVFRTGDIWKTPPEQAHDIQQQDGHLPPIDLDRVVLTPQPTPQEHHLLSVTGSPRTLPRQRSAAGTSTSSVTPGPERKLSYAPSETPSRPAKNSPRSSLEIRENEAVALARDGLTPTLTANTASTNATQKAYEGTGSAQATPENVSKSKSIRKSLHRTLREGHQPSLHRHRKGKDSASTVKSEGSRNGEEGPDHAPGLERAPGKFILHGKQASVITFGGDWTEEKLRLKREMEGRAQSEGAAPNENDESGPDANLRYHVEQAMSGVADGDGYTTDSTAPTTTSRRPSSTNESAAGYDNSRDIEDGTTPRGEPHDGQHLETFSFGQPHVDVMTPGLASEKHGQADGYFDAANVATEGETEAAANDLVSSHISDEKLRQLSSAPTSGDPDELHLG